MAPTVKDVETAVSTSTPAVPSNPVAAPARPQPVPLEVPVSVNGARTIEGSDKREPFSESTKTVLVFANGAVIRLASSVAPGQLLFVTNEKTKKEVVCQVVKSKNYRTVTGYVELEFTESAPGFWGVRIPTDAAPVSSAPKAPVAPRSATPPAPVNQAIGSPKVAVPAPPVPTAARTNIPVAPPPPAKPTVVAPPAAVLAVTPKPEPAKPHALPTASTPPAPVKTESLTAQLAAQLSALADDKPAVAAHPPAPQQKSSDASTDELRQQTARLQEQLSSLLFREATPEKSAAPVAPPTPKVVEPAPIIKEDMLRGADALKEAVAALEVIPNPEPKIETKIETKLEAKIEPSRISSPLAPVAEVKAPAIVSKTSSISLPDEEVKIPSWLAPLARETESAKESAATSAGETSVHGVADELTSDISGESSQKSQSVVFGGQLLGGSESANVQAASSGSKKGLVIGLIAATLLAAAGVAWYGLQPGHFLASSPATSVTAQNNLGTSQPAATPNPVSSAASISTSTSSSVVTNGRTSTGAPVTASPIVDANRNPNPASIPDATKAAGNAARNTPVVEEPKKPVLGDVHLATPNVNRTANASNEAAPTIDGAEVTSEGDPLAGIAASNSTQPKAPLPIGGDVKPAHLLKSTPPIYPPAARSQRLAGDVKLDALIDATGNVSATKIISGPPLLHQAAMAAVKQWKYAPAELDGKPTSMHLTVTVQFRLQ